MKIVNHYLLVLLWSPLVLLITQTSSFAQQSAVAKEGEEKPEWINMMHDPKANYFEVVKAYHEWVEKESQGKAENQGGESEKQEEEGPFHKEKKQFMVWKYRMRNYLRSDGSLISH